MKSKRLSFTFPIMLIVGIAAMWMLNVGYSEIQMPIRIFIAVGAVLLSGVISFFLFPESEQRK